MVGDGTSQTVLEWFTCRKMGKNSWWISFSGCLVQVSLARVKRQTLEIWSKEKDIKKWSEGKDFVPLFPFGLYTLHTFSLPLLILVCLGEMLGLGSDPWKWSSLKSIILVCGISNTSTKWSNGNHFTQVI